MLIEYKKQSKSFNALKAATTVGELKAELQKVFRLNIHRQGLSIKPAAGADPKLTKKLDDDSKTLGEYGVNLDKDVLILKDYGPQIGYRTVFVVEYLGPILIMLAYYLRPSFIYGEKASANKDYNFVAMWGVLAWILHFVKRELETFFVHKFSRPTMPLSNLFKNSIYYWGFALAVGYPLCHPAYTAPKELNQVYLGAALMAVSELVNFLVHLQLSMMRPAVSSSKDMHDRRERERKNRRLRFPRFLPLIALCSALHAACFSFCCCRRAPRSATLPRASSSRSSLAPTTLLRCSAGSVSPS